MIITCPYCQTRYQVASEAIGAVGRKVQCAHCMQAWRASPESLRPSLPRPVLVQPASAPATDDRLFSDQDELGLDEALMEEERALATIEQARRAIAAQSRNKPANADPAEPRGRIRRARDGDLARRQAFLFRQLPFSRVRRAARTTGILGLVLLVTTGFAFRTEIVQQYPALAGLYAGIGLPVNVVGLEFIDVNTVTTGDRGMDVMAVQARIHSVAPHLVAVPPVVVTLLDDAGAPIYEWSVRPEAGELGPGETIRLNTEISSPPEGAETVRLTFSSGRKSTETQMPAKTGTSEAH